MAPKDFGGLGFGSLREFNLAMLVKWWWRFKMDTNSLWRKVIWSVHNNSRNWQFIPVKITLAGPWKHITSISKDFRNIGIDLVKCFKGAPGQGRDILFWKEWWLGDGPLCILFPNLFCIEGSKNAAVADRVSIANGVISVNFSWTRQPCGQQEMKELADLCAALQASSIGHDGDRWMWVDEPTGIFSVRSLKERMQKATYSDLGLNFKWNSWVPIKVNFLTWRLILNSVPTLAALAHRNVNHGSTTCKLCGREEETTDHLFISCNFAQSVWDFVSVWCKIRSLYILELKDLVNIHNQVCGSAKWRKALFTAIQATLWCLWKTRNDAIFNQKAPNLSRLKEEIKTMGFLWFRNRASGCGCTWREWCNFDLPCCGL
ncbi:putative reverse transcriptase zinc-binding domain-containing protein [Helianthus debilis subsp. tardiflorus]